jgi:hypothetical protein
MQAMMFSSSSGQSLRVRPGIRGNARRRLAMEVESPGTCKQSIFFFLLDSWVTQPLVFHALGCSCCLFYYLYTPLINFGHWSLGCQLIDCLAAAPSGLKRKDYMGLDPCHGRTHQIKTAKMNLEKK